MLVEIYVRLLFLFLSVEARVSKHRVKSPSTSKKCRRWVITFGVRLSHLSTGFVPVLSWWVWLTGLQRSFCFSNSYFPCFPIFSGIPILSTFQEFQFSYFFKNSNLYILFLFFRISNFFRNSNLSYFFIFSRIQFFSYCFPFFLLLFHTFSGIPISSGNFILFSSFY